MNNDLPLYIGMHGGDGAFYTGEIDDIRLYNRVLSEDEIQELFLFTPQIPPGISGCIKVQGLPLTSKIVILRQWREPAQVAWTNDEGCYEFETINLDKGFSIRILSNSVD